MPARLVVASHNPVKLEAVRRGFASLFPDLAVDIEPVSVAPSVGNQPRSDRETLRGAEERAAAARDLVPSADYWIGIEGGIEDTGTRMFALAWVVVENRSHRGESRTTTFELPNAVAELVRSGMELGDADDHVFGETDSKRRMGAVGLLTDQALDRTALYAQAVKLALIPFKKIDLYPPDRRNGRPGSDLPDR